MGHLQLVTWSVACFFLMGMLGSLAAPQPHRYTNIITSHGIERNFNGKPDDPIPDVYCEDFTMNSDFMRSDPVYHAQNAILHDQKVILVRDHPLDVQPLFQPMECINGLSRSQGRAKQSLSAIKGPVNEKDYGKKFNGTAYYVGRYASSNPYHLYVEVSFPLFTMLLAHGRMSAGGSNGKTHFLDDCCIFYDNLPPYTPTNAAFDSLDQAVQVCSRCPITNGYIWANHVVVHLPMHVRPNHVNINNWPTANSEYSLEEPVKYLIRQFRHFVFHRLKLPYPETHVLSKYDEPNIVYVKRITGRELTNIGDIERLCKERNCGIKFVTAESLGSGREQVEYFSHVDMLIGIEGAAFVHALHMPMGSVLIQLHPPRDVTQMVASPATGQQIRFPKPYRFFAPIAMYMEHTLVNILMPSLTVNPDFFFETVLKNKRQRGQVIDVFQF